MSNLHNKTTVYEIVINGTEVESRWGSSIAAMNAAKLLADDQGIWVKVRRVDVEWTAEYNAPTKEEA